MPSHNFAFHHVDHIEIGSLKKFKDFSTRTVILHGSDGTYIEFQIFSDDREVMLVQVSDAEEEME